MKTTLWTPLNSKCEFEINENGELIRVTKKSEEYAHLSDEECFTQAKTQVQAEQSEQLMQQAEALMQEILDEPLEE